MDRSEVWSCCSHFVATSGDPGTACEEKGMGRKDSMVSEDEAETKQSQPPRVLVRIAR